MGKEFIELFEQWADTYDESLTNDREYKEVFRHYEEILQEVADRSFGHIVEFGPGTGNLTLKLIDKGFSVTAIEPSPAMRKLAKEKIGDKTIIKDGDFLQFELNETPDTFVSTYAFHHLTDKEKKDAIIQYSNYLPIDGKIVFADTMFESKEDYHQAIDNAVKLGFHHLAEDLKREYYTTIPVLTNILQEQGFTVAFKRFNDFVWIMEGVKK
ncbi:MAG: methyltransferase domain-containing protein [Bacillus sp. (in: firmicutes)]